MPKKDKRAIMLGLDASGKTTLLYKLKLGEVVTTIPTIGFNVETIGTNTTLWDIGGQVQIRPLWSHYMQDTDIIIWAIDSNDKDRLAESAAALANALSNDQLSKSAKLVVVATKQDLPNSLAASDAWEKLCEEQATLREEFQNRCGVVIGIDISGTGFDELLVAIGSSTGKKKEGNSKKSSASSYSGPQHVLALFDQSNLLPQQESQPPQFVVRRIEDGDDLLDPAPPAAVLVTLDASSMDKVEENLGSVHQVLYCLQAMSEEESTHEAFSTIQRLYVVAITGDGPTPDGVDDLRSILKPTCDFMKFTVVTVTNAEAAVLVESLGPELLKKLSPKYQAKKAFKSQLVNEAKALRAVQLAERTANSTAFRLRELHRKNVVPADAQAAEDEKLPASRYERREQAMRKLSAMLSSVGSSEPTRKKEAGAATTTSIRLSVIAASEEQPSENQLSSKTGIRVVTLPNTAEAFAAEAEQELRELPNMTFRRDCSRDSDPLGMVTIFRAELRDDIPPHAISTLDKIFQERFGDQSKVAFRVVSDDQPLVEPQQPVAVAAKRPTDFFSSYDHSPAPQTPEPAKKSKRFLEAVIGTYRPDPIKEIMDDLGESALPELEDGRANAAHDFLSNFSVKMSIGGTLNDALGDPKALVHTLANGGSLQLIGELPLNHRDLFFRQGIVSLSEDVSNTRLAVNNPIIASILGNALERLHLDICLNNPGTIIASSLKETFNTARYAMASSMLKGDTPSSSCYHSTAVEEGAARAATGDFTVFSGERVKQVATGLFAEEISNRGEESKLRAVAALSIQLAPFITQMISIREITNYYRTTMTFDGLAMLSDDHVPRSIKEAQSQARVQALAAGMSSKAADHESEKLALAESIEPEYALLTAVANKELLETECSALSAMQCGIDMDVVASASQRSTLVQNIAPRRSVPLVLVVGNDFRHVSRFVESIAGGRIVLPFPENLQRSGDGEQKGSFLAAYDATQDLDVEFICTNTTGIESSALSGIAAAADAIVLFASDPIEEGNPLTEALGAPPAEGEEDDQAVLKTLCVARHPEDSSTLRRLVLVSVVSGNDGSGDTSAARWKVLRDALPPSSFNVTTYLWDGQSPKDPQGILASALSSFSKPGDVSSSAWDGF